MGTSLTGWRRLRVVIALIGAGFGVVVVVSSLLHGGPYLPDGVEFIPFVLAFPCFGWAVIERAQEQGAWRKGRPRQRWYERGMISNDQANRTWDQLWAQAHKYRVVLAIGIPAVILLWIVMMISIVSLQGQPTHSGNTYYLDDHGSHIPVTKAGFEKAIAKQQSTLAAGGTLFLLVSVGLTISFDPKQPEVESGSSL